MDILISIPIQDYSTNSLRATVFVMQPKIHSLNFTNFIICSDEKTQSLDFIIWNLEKI